MVGINTRGTDCTDAEWIEYCNMPQIRDNETPLVYNGQRKKNIGNYNHIGMERHWKFSCTGNKYCGVNYEEYLKIKQESNSRYDYDSKYALHRYGLWMQNAIKKAEHAREI
ncbi:3452_t:CDS:2, partial [Racocetra persica]